VNLIFEISDLRYLSFEIRNPNSTGGTMKDFEYAAPRSEAEALALLSPRRGATEVLAGGTDLIALMQKMIVTPDRVVNIKEISSLRGIEDQGQEIVIGAITTLDDVLCHPLMDDFPAVKQAIEGLTSDELRCQSTLGGELCHRPRCWYFRNGHGLLAERGRMVVEGDNRYHAIFGNSGPAKFVNASRVAPALIALGARIRAIGPEADEEQQLPLADFYRTPRDESQRENVLLPNQMITHVIVPTLGLANATYEVRHGAGPDAPLAAASAALRIEGGMVKEAQVVLGHVAPTPWVSPEAAAAITNRPVDAASAEYAGDAAVSRATPLKDNEYKVQLAKVAVKRAILRAAGIETGGF
jgi:xanthine dehydrogenase YagS FAD-binding subunit